MRWTNQQTILEFGYKYIDESELIPNYADELVREFTELKSILKEIKILCNEIYKNGGFE